MPINVFLKTLKLSFPQLLEPLVLAACAVVTSDMNRCYTGDAGLARNSYPALEIADFKRFPPSVPPVFIATP